MDISKKDLRRIKRTLNKYSIKYSGHPYKNFGNKIEIENFYKYTCYEYIVNFNYEKRTVANKYKASKKRNFPTREINSVSEVAPWSFKLGKRLFYLKKTKTIKVPKSSHYKTCTSCGGSKSIICNNCNGVKNYPCTYCGEKGSIKCYSCIGGTVTCSSCSWGKTTCRNCGGRGTVSSGLKGVYDRTCYSCNGGGKVYCSSCGGSLYIKCRNCNGTQQSRCGSCGGNGRINCSGCNGSGYKTCYSCNGKGGFEHFIAIEQSFNKDFYKDYFIPETQILKINNIDESCLKSEKHEISFNAVDFFESISSKISYPNEPIKQILKKIKNDSRKRTYKQKLIINSFSLMVFIYKFEGASYRGLVIGKKNTLLLNSSPISSYALNQLSEANHQFKLENFFMSYKILKKINGLPKIEFKKVKDLESLIRGTLNLKKGMKYYKQKVKIKLLGKIKQKK